MVSATLICKTNISIHASRVGGDIKALRPPTPRIISIHASRVGGDPSISSRPLTYTYFNPRLPGGRRLTPDGYHGWVFPFQSTPPGWEATYAAYKAQLVELISIHASRVGGDRRVIIQSSFATAFQSTPPGWEATPAPAPATQRRQFQSTPPGWEATGINDFECLLHRISIHASRVGGDPLCREHHTEAHNFNPRLPGGRRPI